MLLLFEVIVLLFESGKRKLAAYPTTKQDTKPDAV